MEYNKWLNSCLIFMSVFLLVWSSPADLSDLYGPSYCKDRGCCNGRLDSCAVPILGTLCYCDDFCNSTRVDDCCPDYWSYCRGITPPTPSPPETIIKDCRMEKENILINWNQSVKINCNECKCLQASKEKVVLEVLCETNICLINPDNIETVNNEPSYGWTASNYSEFWGRTLDDGIHLRLGTLPPQRFVMQMNPVRRIYDPNSLPRSFDSEEKWPDYISEIQDQGWCASSWAISTAAVASDRYSIVSKGFEQVKLSAQNLISCNTKGQEGCNGGHLDRAWSFVRSRGLVDEDCFPYLSKHTPCTIKRQGPLQSPACNKIRYGERKTRYTVGPAYRLGNETDIMYEITRSGPVQATMKVYHDFFSYRDGIYRHTDLSLYEPQGYHSVRIVGWGEEYTINGLQKYWKVANSWGSFWGENGYFRIAKGVNECEIESFVLATWPHVDRKILNEVI